MHVTRIHQPLVGIVRCIEQFAEGHIDLRRRGREMGRCFARPCPGLGAQVGLNLPDLSLCDGLCCHRRVLAAPLDGREEAPVGGARQEGQQIRRRAALRIAAVARGADTQEVLFAALGIGRIVLPDVEDPGLDVRVHLQSAEVGRTAGQEPASQVRGRDLRNFPGEFQADDLGPPTERRHCGDDGRQAGDQADQHKGGPSPRPLQAHSKLLVGPFRGITSEFRFDPLDAERRQPPLVCRIDESRQVARRLRPRETVDGLPLIGRSPPAFGGQYDSVSAQHLC